MSSNRRTKHSRKIQGQRGYEAEPGYVAPFDPQRQVGTEPMTINRIVGASYERETEEQTMSDFKERIESFDVMCVVVDNKYKGLESREKPPKAQLSLYIMESQRQEKVTSPEDIRKHFAEFDIAATEAQLNKSRGRRVLDDKKTETHLRRWAHETSQGMKLRLPSYYDKQVIMPLSQSQYDMLQRRFPSFGAEQPRNAFEQDTGGVSGTQTQNYPTASQGTTEALSAGAGYWARSAPHDTAATTALSSTHLVQSAYFNHAAHQSGSNWIPFQDDLNGEGSQSSFFIPIAYGDYAQDNYTDSAPPDDSTADPSTAAPGPSSHPNTAGHPSYGGVAVSTTNFRNPSIANYSGALQFQRDSSGYPQGPAHSHQNNNTDYEAYDPNYRRH